MKSINDTISVRAIESLAKELCIKNGEDPHGKYTPDVRPSACGIMPWLDNCMKYNQEALEILKSKQEGVTNEIN